MLRTKVTHDSKATAREPIRNPVRLHCRKNIFGPNQPPLQPHPLTRHSPQPCTSMECSHVQPTKRVTSCSVSRRAGEHLFASLLALGEILITLDHQPEVPKSRWLYAEQFNAIEVDSTYYVLPAERNAKMWTERTPDGVGLQYQTPTEGPPSRWTQRSGLPRPGYLRSAGP
jgi:uncharacterized protein DUF72